MTPKKKQRPSSKIIPAYFPPQQPCWESTVDTCFRKRSPRRSVHAKLLLEPQYSRGKPPGQRGTKGHPLNVKKMARNSRFEDNLHLYGRCFFLPCFCWFQKSQIVESQGQGNIWPTPFQRKPFMDFWRIKTVRFKSDPFPLERCRHSDPVNGIFAGLVKGW